MSSGNFSPKLEIKKKLSSENSTSKLVIKNANVGAAALRDVIIKGNVYVSNNFERFDLPGFVKAFQGRESDIETLDSLFFEQNQKKIVICGLPGYGKTELAKKYGSACLNNENIDSVFWINSEKKEDLQKAFPDLKKIYGSCKEQKCLFIFDNGICRQDTIDYEPPDIDNYFLLVTSQEQDWNDDFVSVKLWSLTTEAAVEVYKTILGDNYKEEHYNLYTDLANFIGNVPLGLQITGGYVRQNFLSLHYKFNLGEYIETVKRSKTDILKKKMLRCTATSYTKSIYGAIKVSLEKINEEQDEELKELAFNALYVCSYLNPMIWFFDVRGILNIDEETSSKNKLTLALNLLNNLSFIYKMSDDLPLEHSGILMHGLTQEILRFHLASCEPQPKENYYEMCAQYAFRNSLNFQIDSIARQADDNLLAIYKIYEKFHNDIITLSNITIPNNEIIVDVSLLENILNKSKGTFCLLPFGEYATLNRAIRPGNNTTEDLERIHELFKSFLSYLVEFKCMKCLTKIFMDRTAHKYIREYELVYKAICCNQPDVINFLLQCVDINSSIDENQNTFLHKAVQQSTSCIIKNIKIFMEYNANVNIKNVDGNVPLFELSKNCQFQRLKWIDYLDILKFDETETNRHGETLLHMAVMGYNYDLTELLIVAYNMDVNQQDKRGRTPLHCIVCNYKLHFTDTYNAIIIVKQFLKYGASLSIKDASGMTPASGIFPIAIEADDMDLVNLMLENI